MKKFISILLAVQIFFSPALLLSCFAAPQQITYESKKETAKESRSSDSLALSAPSVVLMEVKSGTVVYEKDSDTPRHPASVTKIMTMLLIFDALNDGKLKLDDVVTVSEHAASMGGSQVFLEPGETQTVETMLKCISVASANDACVAMAEHIAGSEEEFVARMNERAASLGMKNTTFVNCCGLDTDGHMTSAYDIALMSRELITKYPQIHDYCTIWMENITHETKKGNKEFGLTNTNKLIRQYQYATGLKTGSTDDAKFCVSATAKKDDMELIAVIMGAPDSKARFQDATTLLNYGFSKCQLYSDKNKDQLKDLAVKGGTVDSVPISYKSSFEYVDTRGSNLNAVKKKVVLPKSAEAPLKKGASVGKVTYTLEGQTIGEVDIICTKEVKKATFKDYFQRLFTTYF